MQSSELVRRFTEQPLVRDLPVDAAQAILAHARDGLGVRRVLAIVMPENHDSIRLLERLGMQPTGRVMLHAGSNGDALYALEFRPGD